MVKKNAWKRMLAAALALVTVLSNVVSPMTAYAADSGGESYPKLSEVQEQLSTDEIVTAKDIEVDYGSDFKVSSDFTGISYNAGAVIITLHEAKSSSGASYSSTSPGDYQAVYYVKPTSGDPSYRVSRTITVKESQKETETTVSAASEDNAGDSDSSGDADDDGESDDSADADHAGDSSDPADADHAEESGDPADADNTEGSGESADADHAEDSGDTADADNTECSSDSADADNAEDSGDSAETAETGSDALSTEGGTELTTEEFEAEIEQSEEQETVDEETGMTLATALEEAEEAGIDLAALEVGETVTVSASSLTSSKEEVTITRGSWYYYADYGLGSYMTAPYYISYGSITATAYCVQPSRDAPDDGTYTITKLKDSKTLAKVCYYGTKASGDEGFFAENYPSFSTGKRFIITHLAAAYANGSSDAFSGANSTGKALAMELYNYCLSQPEIPDVDMSFSNDTVTAYLSGSEQRTEEVTFEADELQTVTFDLPDGVKLHNTTTGKTSAAGASVTISGGTTFYLSAPLTQAADVSSTWSTTMKGSITKEYSAYKITTGSSTQDLAFVFGEGVDSEKYVSFKVTWLKLAYIRVVKSDADSGNALSGAVFGVYSDAACTQLIDTMTATGSDGVSELQIVMTQDTVYLKELTTPTGYLLNTTVYPVKLEVGSTTTVSVTNERVNAHITLYKRDSENGNVAQGDATLKGAVYGLYAREDIVHPDGTTGVLYQAGELVATLTTDANGEAEIGGLYLGAYYVKELTPSEGYNLDETEYDLTCDYEGDLVATVERSCISQEDVIKQPFQVIKAANNGKTDADLLSGVGFTVYLVSSLGVNADGSYDFASAEPVVVTADGGTERFTDETGYACSIALPYGTYLVRETTTPHNYEPVDDFIVTITEHNPNEPQVWRILLDKEFEAKLKIIKKDDETKQTVLQANTEFKVYDLENNCYVEQV
ncbi:MAG: Cna protein B-type domain protein, partial [Clostridiales bacterium]|nr:Cna protein B-type domain protein [Clostridiales bacterium]